MESNPPDSNTPEKPADTPKAPAAASLPDNHPAHGHHDSEVLSEQRVQSYWSANIRLMLMLLAIWFVVSFGAGILFVHPLNTLSLGGFPLGFWFAQQGSIFVFVALIFYYAHQMKVIERRFGVDDDD